MMLWFWICAFITRVHVWVIDTPWRDVALAFCLTTVGRLYRDVSGWAWLEWACVGVALIVLWKAPRESDKENDQ